MVNGACCQNLIRYLNRHRTAVSVYSVPPTGVTMHLVDEASALSVTSDFPTGSSGEIRTVGSRRFEVKPKPEPVPDWFFEALQVNFGGAGVPREYAFHVRVSAEQSTDAALRFVFTETNGAGYMDPPYWIRRSTGGWWPVDDADVVFESRAFCEIRVDLSAGETVYVANKPYVTPDEVDREMGLLARLHGFSLKEIGHTAEGRPIHSLETEPREERILVNATMQPAEPAARPVLSAAQALTDRSALSHRLRERFQFCFVPMPNPDGSHHGMSVTNGQGEVPMFSFGRHLEGLSAPAETNAFWSYAAELEPTAHIEFHTHYQDTRYHKLNPIALEWFGEDVRERAAETTAYLLELNDQWRVTELAKDTPIVTAGKFVNLADRLGTIGYCHQIYALTEEATCHQAASAVRQLAMGLAGKAWREEPVEPEIVKG